MAGSIPVTGRLSPAFITTIDCDIKRMTQVTGGGHGCATADRLDFLSAACPHGQVHCMLTQAGLTPDDSVVIDYLEVIKQNQTEA